VIQCQFSKLTQIRDDIPEEKPIFVFAHLETPHAPYIFGPNGEEVPEHLQRDLDFESVKGPYTNQLAYVSKKIRLVIDEILSKSKRPPIILLQGDHGVNEVKLGYADYVENPELGFGILNAYYLPEDGEKLLYDSISPVNSFRVVFNYYFNTNYEILEDRSFYSTYEDPFGFIDVTDKLKTN
jgi:hypothetical protein